MLVVSHFLTPYLWGAVLSPTPAYAVWRIDTCNAIGLCLSALLRRRRGRGRTEC